MPCFPAARPSTPAAVIAHRLPPINAASPGHRIGQEEAEAWVLRCCRGLRLPEPTRLADKAAGGRWPPLP